MKLNCNFQRGVCVCVCDSEGVSKPKKKKEKKKKPMGVWLFPEKHNHGCGQLFVTMG